MNFERDKSEARNKKDILAAAGKALTVFFALHDTFLSNSKGDLF